MTNVNHNALSKFWFSIFTPSTGYSTKVQHYNLLNLKTRNLFFFKNKPVMSIYTKNSLIGRRTYRQIQQIKKRHIKKNLVLKALQVKMYSNDNITNLQVFIHNPDAFYAIQHDYFSGVTRSRVMLMRKKHTTFLVKQLAAFYVPTHIPALFDC
jgi:hypothetical protein